MDIFVIVSKFDNPVRDADGDWPREHNVLVSDAGFFLDEASATDACRAHERHAAEQEASLGIGARLASRNPSFSVMRLALDTPGLVADELFLLGSEVDMLNGSVRFGIEQDAGAFSTIEAAGQAADGLLPCLVHPAGKARP